MPFVLRGYAEQCLGTCRLWEGGRMMAIDNVHRNRGIMRSHNMALDALQDEQWLIIMSAALRFGPEGGLDFIDQLVEHDDHGVISCEGTYGWHLVAFRRDVVEQMGRWDENFTPYGYDDLDLSVRIHQLMPNLLWGGYPCSVVDMGMAHSIKLAGVRVAVANLDYWHRKWGAAPGSLFEDYHTHPFTNISHHTNYWPPINDAEWNRPVPAWEG